ncbi:MAG: glycosyl hydrolase [Marinilabiliales bacterium]|nr:MAG: glycosyl hydrolase [Marinilabiliales bacterium]
MKRFTLSLLLLFFIGGSFAQYQNILISDEQYPEEPSIMMNPKNPNQLVAGANLNSYYISEDGGYNWSRGDLVSQANGVWGDPVIIVDTAGDFYYFHLANPEDGNWIDRIVCQKLDLESGTWNDGSYMGLNGTKAQDKEWAVVDSATNTIYVTWTQFDQYGTSDPSKFSNILFSKSIDAGMSWSEAIQINEVSGNCVDSDNTTEGAVPAVGPDGEIYVAWSGPEGIVFDRSLDGGETWLDDDIFVSDQPGGWDYDIPGIKRCNGLPITCCDLSYSPNRGTIYVNWTDQRNGEDDTDVWIAKSTDGGNTWSEPIRVNNDPPGKQQFFSWMTIDGANGNIYVVFYDRRNYDDRNTDVYIAYSTDGGETFENVLISESPFYPSSNVFFGDYTNITAYNGQVRPIWTRLQNGQLSLWTAIMDVNIGISDIAESMPFTLEQNYPNPFRETTNFAYKLHEPSYITLAVYDLHGRQVALLKDHRRMETGKYIERFDPKAHRLKPGVYYFTLSEQNKIQKRKMLFVE